MLKVWATLGLHDPRWTSYVVGSVVVGKVYYTVETSYPCNETEDVI